MKKGDVGMAKHFSKKSVRMPVNVWCYIPTSLPQEQVAKIKFFQL